VVGILHQYSVGWTKEITNPEGNIISVNVDRTLLYISLAFAVVHAALYASKLGRKEDKS
ncbi:MAG: hypothetical protein JNM19_06580, partial [Chitinophagaceae bacterium]|nr:hypothetical protein [Chitinophagaceae bacterium]